MTSASWLWLAPLVLSLGAVGGCGGSSDGNAAGTSSGGAGGHTGGAGALFAGATSGGGPNLDECDRADCGPQLGLPNWTCADGSQGGPTGRCLERPGGTCGWEIHDCPMAGEGGSASQGGQGSAAGERAVGGAAADDCGGCSLGNVCVFQVGGPGPSHFVCATQNPCGSAAACACIVGQGSCEPNLIGDPPRYCSCDNGLE